MDTVSLSEFERPTGIPFATAIAELIEHAAAAFEADRDLARDYISRASALLRAERLKHLAGTETARTGPRRGGLALWQIKRIVAYINQHLSAPISAKELTDLAQLSASHFFRAFKTSLGMPPFAYIAGKRIERACELMLATEAPLSQIALECGMCDQSHFCRVFRQKLGVTPNAWRRANTAGPKRSLKRIGTATVLNGQPASQPLVGKRPVRAAHGTCCGNAAHGYPHWLPPPWNLRR